jgi:hypothetical protein
MNSSRSTLHEQVNSKIRRMLTRRELFGETMQGSQVALDSGRTLAKKQKIEMNRDLSTKTRLATELQKGAT